jgi:hypothetical protein
LVAQLVEQCPFKALVQGSSPCQPTTSHDLGGPFHQFPAEFSAVSDGDSGRFDQVGKYEWEAIVRAKPFVNVLLHLCLESIAEFFVSFFCGHSVLKFDFNRIVGNRGRSDLNDNSAMTLKGKYVQAPKNEIDWGCAFV